MSSQKKARGLLKEGPLVQMLDRQRVQQAAADEAKKLVDAAALAAERLTMSSTQKTCQSRGPLPLCQILFQWSRRKSVLHVKQMRWLRSILSGIMRQTQM